MKTKTFLMIISLVILLCACHTRKPITYFQPGMDRQEVIKEWGDTPFKTFVTHEGKKYEIWEYNFVSYQGYMGINAYIVFVDGKIVSTHLKNPPALLQILK